MIWGPGPFENDDAADWYAALLQQPSLSAIGEALEDVVDPTHVGFIDVTSGCDAIAAATVLGELLVPASNPDEEDDGQLALRAEWETERPLARERLLRQAETALELVLNDEEDSEARQIIEEHGEFMAEWTEVLKNLQNRLRAALLPTP